VDVEHSYYHVYARGASKQPIFLEPDDFVYFINLFPRYLSDNQQISPTGLPYPHFSAKLQLLAYCLMDNHFHLLFYQVEQGALASFMRSLMTSYSGYFNRKYGRTGSLFESRYKASRIDTPQYLEHISRYIHLNPRYWQRYAYSSFRYYKQGEEPEWLAPQRILDIFASRQEYVDFVADYESQKQIIDELKYELADK